MALYQPPEAAPAGAGQFLRHEPHGGLRRSALVEDDPVASFDAWFTEARAAVAHPETATLSTASLPSGRVSARIVYVKDFEAEGFVVYSNFGTSRKGDDLFGCPDGDASAGTPSHPGGHPVSAPHPGNPWAALTFWWEPLERQVRVEGRAARLSAAESQAYYDTRVRGSRIGAWASRQSAVLQPTGKPAGKAGADGDGDDDGRAQLEQWVAEAEARFATASAAPGADPDHIPVPPFWGGLRIVPERIEFWQGRQNRLHDRFVYDRVLRAAGEDAPKWELKRLSP